MSLLSTIVQDFKKVAGWIDDGLKIAGGPLETIFPQVTPAITAAEALLEKIDGQNQTPALVQQLTTALAAVPVAAIPAIIKAFEALIPVKPASPPAA